MSEPTGEGEISVVHIRPSGGGSGLSERAKQVEAWLRSLGVRVHGVEDVYRGLAELCVGEVDPVGVVVCVDELSPGELEFFSLTARHKAGLTVLVYGGVRSAVRIKRALELGATGVAEEDSLRTLAAGKTMSGTDVAPWGDDPSQGAVAYQEEERWVASTHPTESTTEPTEESVGVTPEEGDLPAGPVRVPWLRYNDAPVRSGPKRVGPSTPAPGVVQPAAIPEILPPTAQEGTARPLATSEGQQRPDVTGGQDRLAGRGSAENVARANQGGEGVSRPVPASEEYEPLLTEEELRALLGDDFGSGAEGGNAGRS